MSADRRGVRLRPATTADLEALVAVEESAASLYVEAGPPLSTVVPRSAEGLRDLLSTTRVYVAEEAEVVGYVSFYATGPYLHLEELAVARPAQGRGIAGRMLEAYFEQARADAACTHLSLVVFRAAQWATRLYARRGFRAIEPGGWDGLPEPERLRAILVGEEAAGLDPRLRQMMVRAAPGDS